MERIELKERNDLQQTILEIKRKVFMLNSYINRLDSIVLSDLDLSVQQAKILFLLAASNRGEVYQKDVDALVGITHSTSSGILSRMKEKGLIDWYESKKDKRCKSLVLTEKGIKLVPLFASEFDSIEERLVSGIEEKDLKDFLLILSKMIKNIKID